MKKLLYLLLLTTTISFAQDSTFTDCAGNIAPESWLGDGFCDDGSYEYNGNQIFFNCEEFNNDEGDCDVLQRSTEKRAYPNGRIKIQ